MSVVNQDPLAVGQEEFTAQQWYRAYELLGVAEAGFEREGDHRVAASTRIFVGSFLWGGGRRGT